MNRTGDSAVFLWPQFFPFSNLNFSHQPLPPQEEVSRLCVRDLLLRLQRPLGGSADTRIGPASMLGASCTPATVCTHLTFRTPLPTQGSMASPGFPFCECLFPKNHYFSLQDGLPHFALQTARNTEHKKRPQSEVNPSWPAGGGFNKWSNLIMRLVLRGHKTERSRHLPAGILVYTDTITWFRLISGPGDLNTSLSQGYILGAAPTAGTVDRKYPSRTEERVGTLWLLIAGVHSVGQPAVSSCWWPVSSASNAFAPFYIWGHSDLGPLPRKWDGAEMVSHVFLQQCCISHWGDVGESDGVSSRKVFILVLSTGMSSICIPLLSWFVWIKQHSADLSCWDFSF